MNEKKTPRVRLYAIVFCEVREEEEGASFLTALGGLGTYLKHGFDRVGVYVVVRHLRIYNRR